MDNQTEKKFRGGGGIKPSTPYYIGLHRGTGKEHGNYYSGLVGLKALSLISAYPSRTYANCNPACMEHKCPLSNTTLAQLRTTCRPPSATFCTRPGKKRGREQVGILSLVSGDAEGIAEGRKLFLPVGAICAEQLLCSHQSNSTVLVTAPLVVFGLLPQKEQKFGKLGRPVVIMTPVDDLTRVSRG